MMMTRLPRSFVTCLAGSLVFMLLIVMPSPAANAVPDPDIKYGTAVNFHGTEGFSMWGGNIGVSCDGTAFWIAKRENGLIRYGVRWRADCNIMRPGNPPNNGAIQNVGVSGQDEVGECAREGTVEITRDDVGAIDSTLYAKWEEVKTTTWLGWEDDPGTTFDPPIPGLGGVCTPDRLYHSRGDGSGLADGWSADLPSLGDKPTFDVVGTPSHSGNCPKGTPQTVSGTKVAYGSQLPGYYYNGITGTAQPGLTGKWYAQWWQIKPDGTRAQWGGNIVLSPDPQTGQTTINFGSISPQLQQGDYGVYGIQLWNPKPNGEATDLYNVSNAAFGSTPTADQRGPGSTNPAQCMFWLGTKAWTDNAAGGPDEPYAAAQNIPGTGQDEEPEDGPVVEPTDPGAPDAACNFDIADPGSWISGSACALVGLLGKVVDLLLTILNAIIGLPLALIDAIGQLFIPDEAALSETAAGVKDSWSESSIGSFGEDFAAIPAAFNPASGGCSGPTIPIHQAGVDIDWKPMNACSGTGATVANVARAAVMLSVLIGTAYAILRMLGAALGLNLNGIGGRND